MAALKAHSMVDAMLIALENAMVDAIVDGIIIAMVDVMVVALVVARVVAMVVARAIGLNLVFNSTILPSVFAGGGYIISVMLLARLLIVED